MLVTASSYWMYPKSFIYFGVLHGMAANSVDCFGAGANDVVLPVVPMFHANAWAIAFMGPMAGSKLVMPGPKLDGQSIYELIESEGVTFSAAVPTGCLMLLNHLRENKLKIPTLKKVIIGGSAVPEAVSIAPL